MFNVALFKERLKIAREKAGLNQEELAKLVGVTKSSISYYESPTTKTTALPNAKVLYEITRALGVSLEYLAGETVYETPTQKEQIEGIAVDLAGVLQRLGVVASEELVDNLTAIVQSSFENGITTVLVSTLSTVIENMAAIALVYDEYSHYDATVHGLLRESIDASTVPPLRLFNGDMAAGLNYLRGFTYEALPPVRGIQDAAQAVITQLQERLLQLAKEDTAK